VAPTILSRCCEGEGGGVKVSVVDVITIIVPLRDVTEKIRIDEFYPPQLF
jgi:hypothetical protein